MTERRWVVDTPVLVSRVLAPDGVAAQAVRKATDTGFLLMSEATLAELAQVLSRRKFDAYVPLEVRREFIRKLDGVSKLVTPGWRGTVCRDPNDDKFLHVAVNGQADAIVTGDADLLALHPFHGVDILTPADFLRRA